MSQFPSLAPDQHARFKRRQFAVIPNSAEHVSTKDCQILAVYLSNDTAGALTFTMTEITGGAQPFDAYSIPAQGHVAFEYHYGITMNGGFDIISSAASGVNVEVVYLESARITP